MNRLPAMAWRMTRQTLTLLVLFVALALPAQAEEFSEGIDYTLIEPTLRTVDSGRAILVTELFWYGCPHCNRLQGPLHDWVDDLPDDVRVEAIPAVFSRQWEQHARAYYTAELLGFVDESHSAMFRAIHDERRNLTAPDHFAEFYAEEFGADRERVLSTFDSFGVQTKIRRAGSVSRGSGVDGVPAFIVAGKYATTLSMNGSAERLFRVLDYLVEKERQERP